VCEYCVLAKVTAKRTKKDMPKEAENPGERLYFDLSGPYKQTRGRNKYHGMLVDQKTKRVWSFFRPSKTKFDKDLESTFEWLKNQGHPVKYLRLNNAGEWVHLKPICMRYGIKMEYTTPNMLQFNGAVERAFPTVRNMAYASLLASDFDKGEQKIQWANAIQDAMICRNLMPRKNFKATYEPFGEDIPVKPEHLMKFGQKGWTTIRQKIKEKFTPKAEEVKRVGYAMEHSSDSYVVWKKSTQKCVISRDVTWAQS